MATFDDWWNSLTDRMRSICIALVKCALKDIPEAEPESLEQLAMIILAGEHQFPGSTEHFRFMVEFIQRCEAIWDSYDQALERQGIFSHSEVTHYVESEVQSNIEIKATLLGLVLKESNDLAYLAESGVKILNNAVVEGDVARLEEEAKQIERELLSAHQVTDLEVGEFLEWGIDLAGCPNLLCQYNNSPDAEQCKKCGASLLGECPECYNEIPITSSYCRVCGKSDLEQWAILHRFTLSVRMAIAQKQYAQAAALSAHIPQEILKHPEIVMLKEELLKVMPKGEEREVKLAQKVKSLSGRWIGKIEEILSEKRPNFIVATQALDLMPSFLKTEAVANLRKEIEKRRKEVVEEGRTRKRNLLLRQIDLLQEKGRYQESIAELNKFMSVLQDEILLKKREELEQTIAEVEKLKERLQGPSWAIPGELQKKTALRQKLSVAREFELAPGITLCFILIPPGSFEMGSDTGYENERPRHRVEITSPFYLAITPVTQAQWRALLGSNPSHFQGDPLPMEQVSWQDCCNFVIALTKKFGEVFRFPTEAEWEYACRAESPDSYSFGKEVSLLSEHAWFNKNSGKQTHPVASKKTNPWGLYDMHGNVWEWCQDCYDENSYSKSPGQDPMGPLGDKNSPRVCRGGSWNNIPSDLRCSTRQSYPPNFRSSSIGFRPVLVVKMPSP